MSEKIILEITRDVRTFIKFALSDAVIFRESRFGLKTKAGQEKYPISYKLYKKYKKILKKYFN